MIYILSEKLVHLTSRKLLDCSFLSVKYSVWIPKWWQVILPKTLFPTGSFPNTFFLLVFRPITVSLTSEMSYWLFS